MSLSLSENNMRENNMSVIQTNISAIMNAATNNCTEQQKQALDATGLMIRPFSHFRGCLKKLQRYGVTIEETSEGQLFIISATQPAKTGKAKRNVFKYDTPDPNDRRSLKMTDSSTGADPQVELTKSYPVDSDYPKKPSMTNIIRTGNELLAYCKPSDISEAMTMGDAKSQHDKFGSTPPPLERASEKNVTTAQDASVDVNTMLEALFERPTDYDRTIKRIRPIIQECYDLSMKADQMWNSI